jgi:uncharacterized delta-60 repeat protein
VTIRTRGLGISVGLIAAVVSLSLAAGAQAAAGDLDPTFSGDGKQFTDFPYGVDRAAAAVRQPDGKIVVVGRALRGDPFAVGGGATDFAIARYNPDGSLDPSFSDDGLRTTSFAGRRGSLIDDRATGVAVQADGKIVVVGTSNGGGFCCRNSYNFALARYNPDGTLDTSFSGDGRQMTKFGDDGGAAGVAIQGNGRIVAVGKMCRDDAGCNFAVARYTSSGLLDTTFSGDGKRTTDFGSARDSASDVVVAADGKITAVGVGGANDDFALARYASDGSLDPTFSGDGKQTTNFGASDGATGVAAQVDGKLVVAGPGGAGGVFARYKPNGVLDPTFSGDGKQETKFLSPSRVALQANGKIVGVGAAGGDFAVVRYRPDGSSDRSFSGDGKLKTDFGGVDGATGVALEGNGPIVAAGTTCRNGCDFAVARYESNGGLDPGFAGDGKERTSFGGFIDEATAVALQDDGKIVAVGRTKVPQPDFAIARYNPDGSLDTSFSGDGMETLAFAGYDVASGVVIQPDGKIVVSGGTRPTGGGPSRFAVARYNPNGTLDTAFSGDGKLTTGFGGGDSHGTDVALQADGKIVEVGGTGIGSVNGHCCRKEWFAVARYNPDGTLDTSFSGDGRRRTDFGDGGSAAAGVAIQGRKIVAAGFGDPNDDFALARYKPNGSLDTTFSGDGKQTTDIFALDGASDVALQGGKIVAVGGWFHPNGAGFAMTRYNNDGTLDTSFANDGLQTAGFGEADAGVVAPNGKIVVVGEGGDSFRPGFAVARYNPNGSLDTSFGDNGTEETDVGGATGLGGAGGVALQDDGKIVAVGTGQGPTQTDDFALVRYLSG